MQKKRLETSAPEGTGKQVSRGTQVFKAPKDEVGLRKGTSWNPRNKYRDQWRGKGEDPTPERPGAGAEKTMGKYWPQELGRTFRRGRAGGKWSQVKNRRKDIELDQYPAMEKASLGKNRRGGKKKKSQKKAQRRKRKGITGVKAGMCMGLEKAEKPTVVLGPGRMVRGGTILDAKVFTEK